MRTEADREGSSCWKGMDAPPFQTLQHLCRSSEFVEEVRNLVSILKSLLYKIVIDQLSHTLLGPRSGEGQPGYTLAQLVSFWSWTLSSIWKSGDWGPECPMGEARINHRRVWSPEFCLTCLSTLTWTTRWSKSFVFVFHLWIPVLYAINMVSWVTVLSPSQWAKPSL